MCFYGEPSGAFRREVLMGRRIRNEDGLGRREPPLDESRPKGRRQAQPGRNPYAPVELPGRNRQGGFPGRADLLQVGQEPREQADHGSQCASDPSETHADSDRQIDDIAAGQELAKAKQFHEVIGAEPSPFLDHDAPSMGQGTPKRDQAQHEKSDKELCTAWCCRQLRAGGTRCRDGMTAGGGR